VPPPADLPPRPSRAWLWVTGGLAAALLAVAGAWAGFLLAAGAAPWWLTRPVASAVAGWAVAWAWLEAGPPLRRAWARRRRGGGG
jgi:hypothetical protein